MAVWNRQGLDLRARKPTIHSLRKTDLFRMHRGYRYGHDGFPSPLPSSLIDKTLVAEAPKRSTTVTVTL